MAYYYGMSTIGQSPSNGGALALTEDTLAVLAATAREAAAKAYCPYSQFAVGAALLTDDGRIFTGCNVENISYGLSPCAERAVVSTAIVNGAQAFRALVVYTATAVPTPPCGACRQVLREFGEQLVIVCLCDSDEAYHTTIASLYPHAFTTI